MRYRNESIIKDRLDNTNRELCKDSLIFAGCVAVTIASVYGTIHLSRELLDFYDSGLTLTLDTRLLASWKEAKISLSIMPAAISGFVIRDKCDNFQKNLQYRKRLKDELKNIQNK